MYHINETIFRTRVRFRANLVKITKYT